MTIKDLFGQKKYAVLLEALLNNPHKGFSVKELSKLTGYTQGGLCGASRALESSGLVTRVKIKSYSIQISLNISNPVVGYLQKIHEHMLYDNYNKR